MTGKTLKRIAVWALCLCLCLAACGAAQAAGGDRTLLHLRQTGGYLNSQIRDLFVTEQGICLLVNDEKGDKLLVYPDGEGEGTEYRLTNREMPLPGTMEASEEEVRTRDTVGWCEYQGRIYAIRVDNITSPETSDVEGAWLEALVLENGEARLEETELPQLDWTGMIEEYGQWKSSRYLNATLVAGDRLAAMIYDASGQQMLEVFDLKDGSVTEIPLQDVNNIFPATEDEILTLSYDWEETPVLVVRRLNLEDQSEEEMLRVPLESGGLQGICLDGDTLYFVRSGEVWEAPGLDMEQARAVNDCSLEYDASMRMLPDHRLAIWTNNTVLLRTVDGERNEAFTLNVQDFSYTMAMSEALYDYEDAHGEASVVIRRDGSPDSVLQAMMNQDGQVDIYTMDYSSSEFDALRNRGFLADLSTDTELSAMMQNLYPFARDALLKDGRLIAVPVSLSGSAMGYRADLWEKLGGTPEELPKTWDQFFDWLETLPARVEGTDMSVFEIWADRVNFKNAVLNSIMNQYQEYINGEGRDYAFNTPLLRGLLERLDQLDYDALGLREPDMSEEGGMINYDEYKEPLISTYTSISFSGWSGEGVPFALSFREDEAPVLPVRMGVAFVNPYSQHAAEAAEFLRTTVKNLDENILYGFFQDRTEPLRSPDFEETKENLRQWLEQAKAELEKAENEEDRQIWEESVKNYQESLDSLDDTYWLISPQSIEEYQARTPWLRPLSYDFVSAMVTDANSNYFEIVDGYARGTVPAEELLTTIDRKVQMMRLEGN